MKRAGTLAVVLFTTAVSAGLAPASSLSRAELDQRIERFARNAGGITGVAVRDLDSAEKLAGHNAGRRLILASNTKLYTTAAALGRFGGDHRFATTIHADLPADEVIDGNLYLVGDGDPTLAPRSFQRAGIPRTSLNPLAKAVKKAGIRKVKGKLIADGTLFDRVRGVPYSDWGPTEELRGPLGGLTYNLGWAAGDPATAAAKKLRKRLRKVGVKVGRVALGRLPIGAETIRLGSAPSPRLARIVAQTNRESDNTFAEMLIKRLAARPGRKGTTKRGARATERYSSDLGSAVRLKDGSGLASGNRASAAEVINLLDGVRGVPSFRAFWNSLPKAGSQGTLADRLGGTVAHNRCRAKTGTLDDETTLSGYCKTKADGRLLAFSILMDAVSIDRGRDYQDRMVKSIARYEGG